MKKLLLSFVALVAAVAMNATVVTFNLSDTTALKAWGFTLPAAGQRTPLDGKSITKDGVTLSFTAGTGSYACCIYQGSGTKAGSYDVRTYATGDKLTISVAGTDKINEINLGTSMTLTGGEAATDHTFPAGVTSAEFTGKATLTNVVVTINEDVVVWTPDTIGVTKARTLIANNDPTMNKSHYIKGVVSSNYHGTTWPGYAVVWMNDIENVADTMEGYKIYKDAAHSNFTDTIDLNLVIGDTVLLFADGLSFYAAKSIYETTSGYLVSVAYGPGERPVAKIDTINVTQALAIGNALADNAKSDAKYCVVGYAKGSKTYDATNGYQTTYMTDTAGNYATFEAYKCNVASPGVSDGDKIAVTGQIYKYVSAYGTTIEISSGDMVLLEKGTGLNDVAAEPGKAAKFFENGKLYILKGGVKYDAAGKIVK